MDFVKNNAHHVSRTLLGLMFFVFGLNYFLPFLPNPTQSNEAALDFMVGLAGTGYFFPFLKGTEVLVGIALLANRFSPLALVVLAPITVNILAYNLFLEPTGVVMAAVIIILQVFSMWSYRKNYALTLAVKPV